MSDPQIVTVAAKLFQQITIGENKDITRGRYSQFGRAATFSLYNFANNLFQKDFSDVIGGSKSCFSKFYRSITANEGHVHAGSKEHPERFPLQLDFGLSRRLFLSGTEYLCESS